MRGGSLHEVLRRLRNSIAPGAGEGLADAELLRRWVASRDEAAFEVLVWRHGPMVLSQCRRWLPREHDADDAFQAAFFALARKAGGVRSGEGLAAWLHRVAFRICLHARSASRETALGADVMDQRACGPLAEASARELRAVLDEEVSRLPERYRAPFVLCYFAGRTNAEAARELGRPVGTILSRLATARQRLRVRLSRRGLAPAATAAVLTATAASQAQVPASLASTTVKTATLFAAGGAAAATCARPAVDLTEGVMKAMFAAKIKTAAAVVLSVALLGTGGGMFGYRVFVPGGAGAAEDGPPAAGPPGSRPPRKKNCANNSKPCAAHSKPCGTTSPSWRRRSRIRRNSFAARPSTRRNCLLECGLPRPGQHPRRLRPSRHPSHLRPRSPSI